MISSIRGCGRLAVLVALTCVAVLPLRGVMHGLRLSGVRHRAQRRLRDPSVAEPEDAGSGASASAGVLDELPPVTLRTNAFQKNWRSLLDSRGIVAALAAGLWVAFRRSIAPPSGAPVYLRRAALLI